MLLVRSDKEDANLVNAAPGTGVEVARPFELSNDRDDFTICKAGEVFMFFGTLPEVGKDARLQHINFVF